MQVQGIRVEIVYCTPFVDAANFITGLCSTNPKFGPHWLSDPNRLLTSGYTNATDMEPNIIGVVGFPKVVHPEAKVEEEAEDEVEEEKETGEEEKTEAEEEAKTEEEAEGQLKSEKKSQELKTPKAPPNTQYVPCLKPFSGHC